MPTKKTVAENIEEISFNINTVITKKEKEDFIKCVLNDVALSEPSLCFFELQESFLLNFVERFTNHDTFSLDLDDVPTYIGVKDYLFSLSFVSDLYTCIEKEVVRRNSMTKIVEELVDKGFNFLDDAVKQLDKNGTKLSKLLTNKNIEKLIGKYLPNQETTEIFNNNIVDIKKSPINN